MNTLIIQQGADRYQRFVSLWEQMGLEQSAVVRVMALDEGVKEISQGAYELVFVDVALPEFDQMDVVFELKQVADCPIVLVSDEQHAALEGDAIAKGAADAFDLGLSNMTALRRVVDHSVERYKLEQEQQRLINELVEASFENQRILDELQLAHGQLTREMEARNKSERENALLVETISQVSDDIFVCEPDATVLYCNRWQKSDEKDDAKRQLTLWNLIAEIGGDEGEMTTVLQSGDAWRKVFTVKTNEGQVNYMELSVDPIFDNKGAVVSLVVTRRDVTHQQELERQLLQSQKLQSIGQLAAGIAHEINTPTQYVSDNVQFLTDCFADVIPVFKSVEAMVKKGPKEDSEKLIETCVSAWEEADMEYLLSEITPALSQSAEGLARIKKIVLAMKDFSHPGSSTRRPEDLNKAISSTVMVCANVWKYVANVETDLAPDLPLVPCYVAELNQVVLNMVVNAAHAIGDSGKWNDAKGTIRITTSKDGDQAVITISDNGTGIDGDHLSKIFDPFFTTKEVGRGTGQGLAIAHSTVVEQHGGTINVTTHKGEGTTFSICLPLIVESSESPVMG